MLAWLWMSNTSNTALLVLGHGSSKHPDSSRSVRMHADVLRERGNFAQVHCAFLKEEPFIEGALDRMDAEKICIVPDFLAEGYFTRQVIPAKLNLTERDASIRYAPPVGTHPLMAELIQEAARDVLESWGLEQVSLLVIGHGSTKNSCSKQTLKIHLAQMQQHGDWAQVQDLWLEEAPRVTDWSNLVTQKRVIILPFFLNDGQHGGWDIPDDLGIPKGEVVHGVTHHLKGHEVRLTPALGTSARFADALAAIAAIWSQ